ncbi:MULTISPECIES: AMP-binding protein [Citricoccus]|uniref:AMP-binding protein n=1 Tax=Citricoccus parietis TaxID=592307 RepID=A0ABV6F0I7_9MICC|nr:AMP-binding protein [Citricoccus sp. K5]VXC21889.1 putative acyl-CoA synthetase YngI [Citricoccus sp. K5]
MTRGTELLHEQLSATAARYPDNPAIMHRDRRLTWSEVDSRTDEIARALLAVGISKGNHVALWLPNHPEWLLLWIGAAKIGAVVIPINTRYKAGEAEYVLRQSDTSILFIPEPFLGIDYAARFAEICPSWDGTGSAELPMLRRVVQMGDNRTAGISIYEEFFDRARETSAQELAHAKSLVTVDDTLIIVFTSGTTGHPKGVVHTHQALRMMKAVTAWLGVGSEDRVLGHLPLFHVSGVFSSFLPALISGGAIAQLDQWDTTKALQVIESRKVSVLSGIPTHFYDLLHHPELADYDTSSLRTGWIGGARIPAEIVSGARDKLGMVSLMPVYGLTETTSTTTLGRPTDPVESILAGKGVVIDDYEIAIVDPVTRRPLGVGEDGEIAVRGYTVMREYYKNPQATQAVKDDDGWFYTGDIGRLDDAGYLSVTGRLSDKFIVGGNNVHPADVENVLAQYPGVNVVQVVAGPNTRLGEVPVAIVELEASDSATAEEIIEFCRGRLASFKVPVDVIFVDAWPMTPTGKIARSILKDSVRSIVGTTEA